MGTGDDSSTHVDSVAEGTASEPTASESASFSAGNRIGRYIVEERIGSGAMGDVYAALDPELNRKVALKLLRSDVTQGAGASAKRARLAREAQAQARLSHRNVVTVLDVGTVDDQVFVAMELIDGITLRKWLEPNRQWRDTVTTLCAAGRGLAAAHKAGLIHRDFKPDNVLVANDGRVCVTDFGLARATDAEDEPAGSGSVSDTLDSDPLGTPLTRTGALLGTPRYMAPEQHRRERADQRTDQFSFCVALYEGLYGEHPFGGETVVQLAESVMAGQVADAPMRTKVPGWLRRVVLKGLSAKPNERFPGMAELLSALERDPSASRRRWLAGGGVAAATGAAVLAFVMLSQGKSDVCTEGAKRWDGIWDSGSQAKMATAFKKTNTPFAAQAWARVQVRLDAYTRAWAKQHDQSCRARVNKEEPATTSTQRSSCLSKRWRDVRALTRLFSSADGDVVERSQQAVIGLAEIDDCVDANALQRQVSVATTTDTSKVQEQIADANALVRSGKYAAALVSAQAAARAAAATNSSALRAQVGLLLGEIHSLNGNSKAAEPIVQQAVNDALAGKSEVLVARGYSYLVYLVGASLARFADAGRLVNRADGAIKGVGDPAAMRATFESHLGFYYRAKGEYTKERDHFAKALELRVKELGRQHVAVARSHNNLGGAYLNLDKYLEATKHHNMALTIYENQLGKEHPVVASVLTNLGAVAHSQTEHKQAQKYHERALAMRKKALRPGHPSIAKSMDSLGLAVYRQRKFGKAIKLYEQALAMRIKAYGENHESVALSHHHLADASIQKRKYKAAMTHYRKAIALYETSLGKDHPKLGKVFVNLGIAYKNLGKYDEALKMYARARPIMVKKLNPKHPKLGRLHSNSAIVYTLQGKHDEAIAATHKALTLYEQGLPKGHWRTGMTYYNLGVAYNKADKPTQALKYHLKGLAARQAKAGKNHPAAASSLDEIAIAHWRMKDYPSAMKALRESLRIRLTRFKPDGMRAGICHFYMGFVLLDWRKLAQARTQYEKAVAIFAAKFKADDAYLAAARTGLGRTWIRLRKPARALPFLEKAVSVRKPGDGSPGEAGEARWELAQALWLLNKDKPRAITLAKQAVLDFEASIAKNEEIRMYRGYLAKARAWLATNSK